MQVAKRALHLSSRLERGRVVFFNKHRKVTDSEKQDPDYFEKQARKLPLDDNYISALIKIWDDKIGSERELGLKAADNLVADKITYGLPEVDKTAPRSAYKNLDVLESAPESVKKIFSIEYGTRQDLTREWKDILIGKVNQHTLDTSSDEMKIAWLTALVRHWSMLVDDIYKKTPKKPAWLTHRIWLVINYRRKLLRKLREKDAEAFERIIKELKIAYHVPKQPEHVKTRKAWSEAQLRERVEEEKEKRLEDLHQRYINEREDKLAQMNKRKEELKLEQEKINDRLKNIAILEGEVVGKIGKYEPSLIGSLSETVMHSLLFYHPKPTMTKQL